MRLAMVCLQAIYFYGSLEAGWIDRKAEGWAWYEEREPIEEEVKPVKSASVQISEAKQLLEERLAEAMIDPTEQKVKAYMLEQKKWLHKSTSFAHMWGKVLLNDPELDPTATSHPVSQYGIQLQKEIDDGNRRRMIKDLAQKHGLFFFYEGHSKISQGLAKVVKYFSEKYSWKVVAISVDGVLLDGFEEARVDNGISKQIGIAVFPALFVINPQEKSATPVAYGFVSLDQIEENILLQFKVGDEDE
jgi:conjugal transfer pilus assembly protein TraF